MPAHGPMVNSASAIPPLAASFFANCEGKQPIAKTLRWAALTARLGQHAERPAKDGPCWSPVAYRPGTTRPANPLRCRQPRWRRGAPANRVGAEMRAHHLDNCRVAGLTIV